MIELKNVAVRRDGRLLFSGVDLQLHKGQTVGLTGNNGTGKSTLFATLLDKHHTDVGTISMPKDWQIAHMAQEIHASDQTALDYVLSGDDEWYQLNDKLTNQNTLAQTDIATLYQRFDEIDGYRTPSRASQILSGLGFAENEHTKPVCEFSGGWRMRLNLARTLMHRADVLLLDEPTNHLDLDAILWLEEWLSKFDGLILVISHDQAFMDTICSHIVHIEQGKITLYTGNYTQFIRTRAERLAQEVQAFERQEAIRSHLENFIRRFGAKASKAKQAQSRIKQLANMTAIAPVMADSEFNFKFYPPTALSSPLINLDNATVGYGNATLIHKINLQITPDTRLGILGANGAGKSTLIKALVGELPLLSGTHKPSDNLVLGYFNQHQMDALDNTATPLILLRRIAGGTSDADLRAFLGSFNFKGDKIDTPCQLLSGGERARLTLALIVWQRPNVLVLDEPTNHLDLSMRNALMLALQDYEGALILVSHDRDLVMSVCDSLLLVANGKADEFSGDMADYAEHLRQVRLAKFAQNKTQNTDTTQKDTLTKEQIRKRNAENRQKTAPLRKTIEKLEKSLDTLTTKLSDIETQLSNQGLYHDDNKGLLLDLLDQQNKLQQQVGDTENELLENMDELEILMATLDDDS